MRAGIDFDIKNRRAIDVQNIFHRLEQRTLVAAYRFYCNKDLKEGAIMSIEDINFLRPCPKNSFHPYQVDMVIGKKLKTNKKKNESIFKEDIC